MSPPSPAQLVSELARAHIAARCLHVVAELGVADALDTGPATAEALAAATGADAGALRRVLRLLAAYGVFAESDGGFRHTDASRLLRSDAPRSLRSYVRATGMQAYWLRFGDLETAVRAGKPAADWADLVAYFADHPDQASLFNAAMVAKSAAVVPAVIEAYDFASFRRIADVGGGQGHLLRAILARVPTAQGILFELPHVIAEARDRALPRLELEAGDFFRDPLPAADAYLLMDLLHDWSDADASRILSGVRRAAPPQARLLVVETLVPETPGPHFGKTLDIIMLAITGGRERTAAELGDLLAATGFRLLRAIPTASQYSIVEAVVV